MYSFILILALYFFAAEAGITTVFGHAGLAVLSIYGLYYSSRYFLFWLLLALVFFAAEPRFSFEYLLWSAGLVGLALSPRWTEMSQRKREITLFIAFVLFALGDYSRLIFSERGSLLIWLPVWLTTVTSLRPVYTEPFAALAIFFSSKKAALLAYLVYIAEKLFSSVKSKTKTFMPLILVLLGMLAALGYWLIKHPKFWSNFVAKSIFSRLHIWQSVLNGAFDALPFGHGFGTFAIDFPVYRQHADVLGGHMAEHVAHAHNVLLHFFFEQGLLGIALYLFLLVLIFTKSRAAFLPFLVISVCDASLVSFNQYLLAALILVPSINVTDVTFMRYPLVRKILGTLASALIKPACYLACTLALIFSTLSVTAHYHYDRGNFSKAITLDPYHSLYHFMRGASNLHLLAGNSETDLKRAVELSPHVSYFYGFLAAAHLANAQDLSPNSEDPRLKLASEAINKAIQCDGNDAYWHTLSSFIHYQNPELSKREMQLALKRNPEIEALLKDPSQAASEYIGSRKSDVRISGFYRRGPKVYLPLPYLE